MPGLDGTGPIGKGSGTGRGLGRCNPDNKTGDRDNRSFRRGCGRGFGVRGFRRNWENMPNEKGKRS